MLNVCLDVLRDNRQVSKIIEGRDSSYKVTILLQIFGDGPRNDYCPGLILSPNCKIN
jgi:hypothetical protein